jgi:hypothetical protein
VRRGPKVNHRRLSKVGDFVRFHREPWTLTTRQIAQATGVPQRTVARWLKKGLIHVRTQEEQEEDEEDW